MLPADDGCGRLLIHAPVLTFRRGRLEIVRTATEKVAEKLRLGVKSVENKGLSQIHVYYGNGHGELIPLYRDRGGNGGEKDVYSAIRNMVFVLSFHLRFSFLKPIREEVLRPS